ncbi:dimethylaniline monooxygenase, putative [Ixodes scapularis]|uniref:Flavin-containing monooxygenase n=1 Tax=Ixodes scapularis TaxID=6945 RepID=B7Q3X4_IXOSC|nr:dimethylaniline monooxygenase, putative [Ixodes scapularis]|eukprot:XP_002411411.1 dimethylaniline monooxygenase, putative [Ixodes scapularis]
MQRSSTGKGPLRVCIVGGGSSGILAARQMIDEGFEPVIYELSSCLGGLWAYRGDSEEGMRSTIINSSKEMSAFSIRKNNGAWTLFSGKNRNRQWLRDQRRIRHDARNTCSSLSCTRVHDGPIRFTRNKRTRSPTRLGRRPMSKSRGRRQPRNRLQKRSHSKKWKRSSYLGGRARSQSVWY